MRHTARLAVATALAGLTACFVTLVRAPAPPHAAAPHPEGIDSGYQTGIDSRYQRGIAFDFYWYRGMRVGDVVAADAAYAGSLGANAMSISFPFYTRGSTVAAERGTPSPAAVGQAVSAARSAGLAVYLRPLLDERNLLPKYSRVFWTPASLERWFGSYQAFLLPYAQAAQREGAAGLFVGTELSEFAQSPYWAGLDAAVRRFYRGRLYYAANWQEAAANQTAGSGGQPATVTVDAYPPMPVPPAGFRVSWAAWARNLPAGTVLSEVGITPRAGAQYAPYAGALSHGPVAPQVQTMWFTAACNAVQADHLGGIFFWSIFFGQRLDVAAPRTPYSFVASPGAEAIKRCFSRLGGLRDGRRHRYPP